MSNIYSSFPINIPPLLGTNPYEPVSSGCHLSKESLNMGVTIYSSVSSVSGSSSFFFIQPILTGEVFASVGILIAAQLFMFLADRLFGLESMPLLKGPVISPEQTVRMSLSDLQNFLALMSRGNVQPSSGTSGPASNQTTSGVFSLETPEDPLVFALAIWGDFTDKPFCPTVFITFPLFAFPGVRGALPLLILELLTTIFVRAVVPPETTGAKPLTAPVSNTNLKLLQFSPEDLLNLLNKFGKHYGT